MLEDIIKERKRKLEELQKSGENPFPAGVPRTYTALQAVRDFSKLLHAKKKISVAGRVLGLRDQGNLIFLDIADESGKIQAVLKNKAVANYKILKKALDVGDFLSVTGLVFKTKKGEKSIEVKTARLAAKSLRPLPSEWYGLKDVEERYRKRYLDSILNPETRRQLKKRSDVIRTLREFLHNENFLEVETPILQPIPGGARARPFVTHHNALDTDFFLRVAPELYLKRLLVGGFEKIYELGRVFRNEGIDRDHNPEFTELELYWAYQDYIGLMKFTRKLLAKFIPGKWQVINFAEVFKKYSGKDIAGINAGELDEIFRREVRPKIIQPTLVIDYPESLMPLAKLHATHKNLTESFQLIVGGAEIVKGFSELNDPIFQRRQMEQQEKEFRAGDFESSRIDEDFIESLEYGMPPAAGLGLGIDRLVALTTGSNSLKEVIIFPTLKPKH